MTQPPSKPHVTATSPLPLDSAKWITLESASYIDAKGKPRTWELARRKTTSSSGVDAVAIGNIIHHPSRPPSTLLVLQFRPPLNAITVEWPAGLIDGDESAETAALRELREETGLSGKVRSVGPVVAADPGMSNANMRLVMVDVHMQEGEEMGEQSLDEGEEIERVVVPLRELGDRLDQYAREGYGVAAKLWHWAEGVRFALGNAELLR